MIFGKIVPRLLLGFLLLSPLPLAALAWLYTQAFDRSLQDSQLASLSAIADKKVEQINAYLNERRTDSLIQAQSPQALEALKKLSVAFTREGWRSPNYRAREQGYRKYFSALHENMHIYDLLLIDVAGNVVLSVLHESDFGSNLNTGPYRDSSLARAQRNAMALLQIQNTQALSYAPSGDRRAIFIVSPVTDNGKVIGTLALQLDLEKLTDVTSDTTGLGLTGETVLAQREGEEVIYVGPLRHIPNAAFRYRDSLKSRPPPMKAALLGQYGAGITYDYAGVGIISAWRHLPALGWGMVVKRDVAEVLAPSNALRKVSMLALGLLLLVSVGIAVTLGRSLMIPIRQLLAVTSKLAKGDLSQRAASRGASEFRQLATAFNVMADGLQSSHINLEQQVAQRTAELTEAQMALQHVNTDLEQRVAQRTAELLVAKDAAESASRAKSEFLASMSHELRTPLNAILGYAQLFGMDEDLSEQTKDQAGEIERAGYHLLSLVNDLIDLARIDAGKLELSLEPILLKSVLNDSLAMVAPIAQKHGIHLINENCESRETMIRADYNRLRQVVINLLSNAIKYNRPKGTVTLLCRKRDDHIRIHIVDTGAGIPADKHARIFTSFDRLGKEAGTVEGTGIGLVITQRIVHAMGGHIGFESVEGQGSTFWVEFPITATVDIPLPEQAIHAPQLDAKTRTVVLYVEDNPLNLRLMQRVFANRNDLELRDAHSAEIGIALACADPPD